MLQNLSSLETASLDHTIQAVELMREVTGIPGLTATSDGGAELIMHVDILPRLIKVFTDVSEFTKVEDSDDKELKKIIIPKVAACLPDFKKILPELPTVRAKTFQDLSKKLGSFTKLINSVLKKANACNKTQAIPELKHTMERLSAVVKLTFRLLDEMLFFRGITLPQKDLAIDAVRHLINTLLEYDFIKTVDSDNRSIITDYFLNIFLEFAQMRTTAFLLNKYLKLPHYSEFSKIILKYASSAYLRTINNSNIYILGNIILLEYRYLIIKMMPKGPEKQDELIEFHALCFMQNMAHQNIQQQYFHYRILTDDKNLRFFLSRKIPDKWPNLDKLVCSLSIGFSAMWKRLLEEKIKPEK